MTCFDFLADGESLKLASHWQEQAALKRRDAYTAEDLTRLRGDFLKQHALEQANERGQGQHKVLPARNLPPELMDTARRAPDQALAAFPVHSARLLLRFRLLTPLLTKDDDPFYLFDNPVRKDHILGLPYLSAAGLKGLAADAYQRAFCDPERWSALGDDDPARTHAFRIGDPHALRLFGLADDGVARDDGTGRSQAGRLRVSPVWFQKVQLLVMNPNKAESATGSQPIQFEAIAPGQDGLLELVYFNPAGTADSDLATVRADLARLLGALAAWWPALGLGAKRLAGYGAIEPLQVELQALGWPDLDACRNTATPDKDAPTSKVEPPSYHAAYVDEQGEPIAEAELEQRIQTTTAAKAADIETLDKIWRKSQGKEQKKARKKLDSARKSLQGTEQNMRGEYRKVAAFVQQHGPIRPAEPEQSAEAAPSLPPPPPLGHKTLTGPESWRQLAHWLAGGDQ